MLADDGGTRDPMRNHGLFSSALYRLAMMVAGMRSASSSVLLTGGIVLSLRCRFRTGGNCR